MAKCFDKLVGDFQENCDRPLMAGLKRRGIIANVEDIASWSGTGNKFKPTMAASKRFFEIEVLGATPFAGSNVASEVDEWTRDFTKTVVFNLPESGATAAAKIEQLTKSLSGFVIIVEGKDTGTDGDGNFVIFGKDNPLLCTVAKDYTAGVASPVITATTKERNFENFLFDTNLATTKTLFTSLSGEE